MKISNNQIVVIKKLISTKDSEFAISENLDLTTITDELNTKNISVNDYEIQVSNNEIYLVIVGHKIEPKDKKEDRNINDYFRKYSTR